MPRNQAETPRQGLPSFGEIVGDIPRVFRASFTARFAILGLIGVLAYLFIGQIVRPGFTDYWWYQVFQTTITLAIVVFFNAAFADEGGMSIMTHIVVISATLADTIGTAGGVYHSWGPYDKIVHFASGAAFAAGTYQALNFMQRRGTLNWSALKRGAVCFAGSVIVTGFIWETYEYLSDVLFKSGRVQSRNDTIGDLIADSVGALLAVGIIFQYERKREREEQGAMDSAATAISYSPNLALGEPDRLPLHPVRGSADRDFVLTRSSQSSSDD